MPEEKPERQQFYAQNQLTSEANQAWLEGHRMTAEQLEALATRGLRIENSSKRLGVTAGIFTQSQRQLDRVIYSLLRTKIWRLPKSFIRIQEGAVLQNWLENTCKVRGSNRWHSRSG